MKTEDLSTLKIHKLTQAQYDRELAAGNIDEDALYLTPDTPITPADIGAQQLYTNITQLGLTIGSETIEDIFSAMSPNSVLRYAVTSAHNTAIYPYDFGIMEVKYANASAYRELAFTATANNSNKNRRWCGSAQYVDNAWVFSDWFELLHTGNTGSLADFNKYLWKRRKVNPNLAYGEEAIISFAVGTYKTKTEVSDLSTISFTPESTTISYSSNYSTNLDSISFALANSTSATISTYSADALSILKGKYWKRDNTYYYTDSNAITNCTIIRSNYGQIGTELVDGVGYVPVMGYIYSQMVTISATKTVALDSITYGNWETVTSTSATAYPETFTYSGGYEYIKYGGMDRRQTSTAIKHMTFYGTGASAEKTIYVDEIPTLFIIYENSTPILFKWGYPGIVLVNNASSGITTISATYNTANKSITFSKVFGEEIYPMNAALRYHCYLIYG